MLENCAGATCKKVLHWLERNASPTKCSPKVRRFIIRKTPRRSRRAIAKSCLFFRVFAEFPRNHRNSSAGYILIDWAMSTDSLNFAAPGFVAESNQLYGPLIATSLCIVFFIKRNCEPCLPITQKISASMYVAKNQHEKPSRVPREVRIHPSWYAINYRCFSIFRKFRGLPDRHARGSWRGRRLFCSFSLWQTLKSGDTPSALHLPPFASEAYLFFLVLAYRFLGTTACNLLLCVQNKSGPTIRGFRCHKI